MPSWARYFVLLAGMLAWLAIVGVSLRMEQIPSAMIVGFPPALWLALSGGSTIAQRRANQDQEAAATEAEPTEQEGDPV